MTIRTVLSTAVAALLALAAGIWVAARLSGTQDPELESGIVLKSPRPIADFALRDQDGRSFSKESLAGRWSLLFAGFTHCPDVCPTTLQVMKLLEDRLGAGAPRMLFLSVDPERDAPDVLRRYVRHFSPSLTGITGPLEELERLCASLGLAFVKVPGARENEYTVDHSAALVLIDPSARVAGYFQPPLKVDTLATDLSRILPSS